jgi:hypothetical protein
MTNKSKTKLKRFVIIFGSKGGIGKSAYGRFVLDECIRLNLNYCAYDADQENPDLYRYYHAVDKGVELANFLNVGDAGELLENMSVNAPDLVLLDLPASSGNGTREIFEQFGLLETAVELGYRITLLCVINTDDPVLGSIGAMAEFCQDKVDYVIVKNLCWGKTDEFKRWDNGKLKPQILEQLKGKEIEMPRIDPSAFLALSKAKTPYHLADKDTVGFGSSLLVKGFLIGARAEFVKANEYWGIA